MNPLFLEKSNFLVADGDGEVGQHRPARGHRVHAGHPLPTVSPTRAPTVHSLPSV